MWFYSSPRIGGYSPLLRYQREMMRVASSPILGDLPAGRQGLGGVDPYTTLDYHP